MSSAINRFLLQNELRIVQDPCISPDFCLDWAGLQTALRTGACIEYPKSRFMTAVGEFSLVEQAETGDCAWKLVSNIPAEMEGATSSEATCDSLPAGSLDSPFDFGGATYFPATWENLLRIKNLILEYDEGATIFPTAAAPLGRSTLGVGARFTTLHWPAVEWTMAALGIGLTANQNSIPRELVYDVDAMLEGRLESVPFPFIGADVPEGHQGQSVEGMSHGCVLSKLKTGFHKHRIAWAFNADHQPIGGKFDDREEALVRGCLLASYITFDISPELALARSTALADIPPEVIARTRARVAAAGLALDDAVSGALLSKVWGAMLKMQQRDRKYAAVRAGYFTTGVGRRYLRELSIDELPGLTTPETTAVMLALCEVLGMPVNFIAPAFGFQKNTPHPDNVMLRRLIDAQWEVCSKFGVSIGFHSGSGKSAENYQVMGQVTGGLLEIKTSGRYTYEMGVALSQSRNVTDVALWRDWYRFTLDMAVAGAHSDNLTECDMARSFIMTSLNEKDASGGAEPEAAETAAIFTNPAATRQVLESLPPSADHMFFFEYNFLYVLAAGGRTDKSALGDHSAAGYRQRARFYAVSNEARFHYSKRVAGYLVFLAEHTGIAPKARCALAREKLAAYDSIEELLAAISP